MAHTKKIVGELERAAKQYKADGEQEMEKYQNQDQANQTGRQFNLWLRRMVKLFIQEELMRAKMHQILSYNENLVIKKEDDLEDDIKIAEKRISEFFQEEDPDVMKQIRVYEDWIRSVYKYTLPCEDHEYLLWGQSLNYKVIAKINELQYQRYNT